MLQSLGKEEEHLYLLLVVWIWWHLGPVLSAWASCGPGHGAVSWAGPALPSGGQQGMEAHCVRRRSHPTHGTPLVTHSQKPRASTSWCSVILHSGKMLTDERGRCLREAGHQAPVVVWGVKEKPEGHVREAGYPEMAVEGLLCFNAAWSKQRLFRNKTEQQ